MNEVDKKSRKLLLEPRGQLSVRIIFSYSLTTIHLSLSLSLSLSQTIQQYCDSTENENKLNLKRRNEKKEAKKKTEIKGRKKIVKEGPRSEQEKKVVQRKNLTKVFGKRRKKKRKERGGEREWESLGRTKENCTTITQI